MDSGCGSPPPPSTPPHRAPRAWRGSRRCARGAPGGGTSIRCPGADTDTKGIQMPPHAMWAPGNPAPPPRLPGGPGLGSGRAEILQTFRSPMQAASLPPLNIWGGGNLNEGLASPLSPQASSSHHPHTPSLPGQAPAPAPSVLSPQPQRCCTRRATLFSGPWGRGNCAWPACCWRAALT
ncbi:PREDICTED: MAPK-interacting and spindle-stabilizing protein-like isoform X2 [Myotis brandtii]|uniref:MAPK-interacting and spindle-stabilizing protein-like isoform X2 n=1 Tax=Myotis brandtii TaxID=109478 RepID=UPI0003BBD508|nr:PREDICTED: MAPK-interacting and spindle-stabilizing protein-like isoform X2 [Myotis brandtii]